MQLILAIVADQQQTAQLAALIDGRLAVDLVLAAEVGEGLLALDDRIPDLILTSPWMSPFDDGVLDEYLRDLGPAGAHVQSLRIPVLSQAPKKAPRLGFSLRRRSKPEAPTIDGCEPKVFADEIAQYLARAAEEKRHASTNESAPVIERQMIREDTSAQPIREEEWTPAYSSDAVAETAWAEPESDLTGWRSDLLDRPPVAEHWEPPVEEVETGMPLAEAAPPVVESFDEQTAVNQTLVDAIEEPLAGEPASVEAAQEAPVVKSPVVEAIERSTVVTAATREAVQSVPVEPKIVETPIATPPAIARAAAVVPADPPVAEDDPHSKATPSFKAALAAIRAAWGKPSSHDSSSAQAQETIAAPPQEPVVPVAEVATERPFAHAGPSEALDVYELSVEPDMKELESELAAPSLPEPSGDRRKKPAKRPPKAAKAKSPRQPQPQAAQDEWGIFDPNRCGFAAVVDKLDQVSDAKTEQPRNVGKGRVISCS